MGDLIGEGIASSGYARDSRDLIKLVNQIRSSGAQLVVDLPRIAVIGKQSAGKSSLIEAISAIKVPRDSGTCTRCPMEVRLQHSTNPWRCQVSLRFESNAKGPLDNIREVTFGPALTDPSAVEDTLRRAQLAILNPGIADTSKFFTGPSPGGPASQLEFSTNIVCVDISGPEVADLAFVDLPGLIANGKQSLIDLVRNLVEKYIKGNCLILVALTVGDDLENQSAAHLAREQDPSGERTIGVLTKADRLPAGEDETWLQILRNQRTGSVLRHGYYSTKLASAEDLRKNPTFAAARQAEESYFAESKPWSTLEIEFKSRLGTQKLTNALSELLKRYIREKLPGLVAEINKSLSDVTSQIRALPAPPSADASFELIQLATRFSTTLERVAAGAAGHKSLVQDVRQQFLNFKKEILDTVPYFVPYAKGSSCAERDYVEPSFLETDGTPSGTEVDGRLRMDLDDVQKVIREAVTRELPFNVPFDAKKSVILLAIQSWKDLSLECLSNVRPLVLDIVAKTVEEQFGRYSQGPLRSAVLALAIEEVEKLYKSSREKIEWLSRLNESPFTQNTHYLSATREKLLTHYHGVRQDWKSSDYDPDEVNQAIASLAEIGLPSTKESLMRLFPDDEYLEELIVMAETRAYFQIAYKRVIDEVPLAIDCDLIRPLGDGMLHALLRGLGVSTETGASRAAAWLSESPTVTKERKDLARKKESLEEARRAVRSFGVGGSGLVDAVC